MIPADRIRRALLNVEKREVLGDITQIEAAILHLQGEGKKNYDAAKKSNDRQEDYGLTPDEILNDLQKRLKERKAQLKFLDHELAILSDE